MSTIYVFKNELLEDGDEHFGAALIGEHTAATDKECLEWFESEYGSKHYTASFAPPLQVAD
jgi:hypothetical protein